MVALDQSSVLCFLKKVGFVFIFCRKWQKKLFSPKKYSFRPFSPNFTYKTIFFINGKMELWSMGTIFLKTMDSLKCPFSKIQDGRPIFFWTYIIVTLRQLIWYNIHVVHKCLWAELQLRTDRQGELPITVPDRLVASGHLPNLFSFFFFWRLSCYMQEY